MTIELEHRFGRDSPVRDYWLAASEGFDVCSPDGRPVGVVRQVVRERDGRAVALVVESRHGLARIEEMVVEAEEIEEVAPWRETLVLASSEAPAPPSDPRWPALRRAVAVALSESGRSAANEGRWVAATARARWPTVQAWLVQAWAWAVAVVVGVAGAAAVLARSAAARLAERLSASRSQ